MARGWFSSFTTTTPERSSSPNSTDSNNRRTGFFKFPRGTSVESSSDIPIRIRHRLSYTMASPDQKPDCASTDGISTLGSHDSFDGDTTPPVTALPRSPRSRINSRDIPRTYSGLYGEDDLLPFECQRQRTMTPQSLWFVLGTYITLIVAVQLVVVLLLLCTVGGAVEAHQLDGASWTLTNAIHLAVTIVHVHWLKGSVFDPQGEMNALTIWEQLEARGSDAAAVRQALLIIPTLLCYAACHFSHYAALASLANIILWLIAMLAKSPFMCGVRVFGINRTVGIDDDNQAEDPVEVTADKKEEYDL